VLFEDIQKCENIRDKILLRMKDIKTNKGKERKAETQKDKKTEKWKDRMIDRKTGRLKVIENKNSKSLLLKVRLILQ
jgi:hypothetical protein